MTRSYSEHLKPAVMAPSIFLAHGSPMNALADNRYTRAWRAFGERVTPRAVLAISAHWVTRGTAVTAMEHPRTIHDFGSFPRELFEVEYRAPGDPQLAQRVQELLMPTPVTLDQEQWGLDHGTWSVLRHVYPDADVPVIQLSIDETQPPAHHFEIGRRLATLRDEGILIMGSGNLVHNLHTYAWGRHAQEPYDWAVAFERRARDLMVTREFQPLIEYESLGRDAILSVPTPDHYLPLLYVLGACRQGDAIAFPV